MEPADRRSVDVRKGGGKAGKRGGGLETLGTGWVEGRKGREGGG